jgi:hypothetical protein
MTPDDPRRLALSLYRELRDAPLDEQRRRLDEERRRRPDVAAAYEALVAEIDTLVDGLFPLPAEERGRRLDEEEGRRPEVAREARRLLAGGEPTGLDPTGPPPGEGPPRRFGGYRLLGELGSGGMGTVYHAWEELVNRPVALKIVRPDRLAAAGGAAQVARLRAEAEHAARLRHANIVEVFAFGVQDGLPFYAMRLVGGPSLAERLDGTPLPPRQAAALVRDVARAVHHAHQRGVIHRDLKPGNILLDEDGQPHVADFGLSCLAAAPVEAGAPEGTPEYMAPEQARGDADLTAAVDVWALGVILYQLLSGRLPFGGRAPSLLDLFRRVEKEGPPPLDGVDSELGEVCLRCLNKDRDRRYRSAADLADDLERWLNGEETSLRPWSRWRRWKARCRRRPAAALLPVFAVALLLSLTFGLFESARRARAVAGAAARELEQEKKQRLADALASAREAAGRGDWRSALAWFERARQMEGLTPQERLHLEIEALPGWFIYRARRDLERELGRLAGEDLRPEDRARVVLLQGDLLMSDLGRYEEGQALVRRARAAGLPPADAAYADALLAPTSGQALARLRVLLERHPRHLRGHHALLGVLLVRGEYAALREALAVARNAFPDDPTPHLVAALADVLERGDLAAAGGELGAARGRLGEERWRRTAELLERLHAALEAWAAPADAAGYQPQLFEQLLGLAAVADDGQPFSLNIPTVGLLFPVLKAGAGAYAALRFRNSKAAEALLGPVCAGHPEAYLLALRAAAAGYQTKVIEDAGRPQDAVREGRRAADLFHRAADAPTVLPRAHWRYQALVAGLLCDAALIAAGADADGALAERLRGGLARAVADGRAHPDGRRTCLPVLLDALPPETARVLLLLWLADSPDERAAWRLLPAVELRAGHFGSALALADAELRWWRPRGPALAATREQARRGLLAQLGFPSPRWYRPRRP